MTALRFLFALVLLAMLAMTTVPVLMTFLIIKDSGGALLETGMGNTRSKYRGDVRSTSALVPRPGRR